jgi:hypothetical protein
MTDNDGPGSVSRRRLLVGAGAAGAGLAAASAGVLPGLASSARAAATPSAGAGRGLPPGAPANSMLFGRIFPQLPPFAADTPQVQAALV